MPNLPLLDQCIVAAYLLAVIAIGIWAGRGKRDLRGYVLADRNLPWWALLGSIIATETSSATFLSVPGISISEGGDLRFLQLALGFLVGRILVAWWLMPGFFRGERLSAYELLEQRFGTASRRTAAGLFLAARNLGDGLRLFLGAAALNQAFGVSMAGSILLIGVVTIVYTLVGGMRSVVWNDCLQLVVYLAGGIAALVIMLGAIPEGWGGLMEFARQEGKLQWLDTDWDLRKPYTLWAGLIGGACLSLGTHGTDQTMVQRYFAARSRRDATLALVLSGVAVALQFAFFLLIGIGLACFFRLNPASGSLAGKDAAFIQFIVHHMPQGLAGLTIAAVFAAVMSTIASSLNSAAAVTVRDFGGQRLNESPAAGLLACQWATAGFGVLQMAIAGGAANLSGSVVEEALAIAGFAGGLLLGIFLLGLWVRDAGGRSLFSGLLVGVAAVAGAHLSGAIAWPWYSAIGAATILIVGRLASLKWVAFAGIALLASPVSAQTARPDGLEKREQFAASEGMLFGIDVLVRAEYQPLQGRAVGLITNQTGADREGRTTASLLAAAPGVRLVALFSPEHGIAGKLDDLVADGRDETTGVPVYSLYGANRAPGAEQLAGIDTLVFDIQDIGCRFYTYISTMELAMRAAARHGIRFVVLDRPNPLGGVEIEGPVLDAGRESFTGCHTLPVRHGMTVGELARMFNDELAIGVELEVIAVEGWRREDWFDATGRMWVDPSPNIRRLGAATLYPGVGLLEFTNLSVGRGTETPFEVLGAPWLDGVRLAKHLNDAALPGLRCVPIRFTPTASRFAGEACGGINLIVTDRAAFKPVLSGIAIAAALRQLHPDDWDDTGLDRLLCDTATVEGLRNGKNARSLEQSWQSELDGYRSRRDRYLLY